MDKEKEQNIIDEINKDPENLDKRRALADFYINEGKLALAYDVYQDILKLNDCDMQALLN